MNSLLTFQLIDNQVGSDCASRVFRRALVRPDHCAQRTEVYILLPTGRQVGGGLFSEPVHEGGNVEQSLASDNKDEYYIASCNLFWKSGIHKKKKKMK